MSENDRTATDRTAQSSAQASVPVPQLFMVLRCDDLRAPSSRHALSHVDEVLFGRGDGYGAERTVEDGVRRLTLRIPDPRMSRSHARLSRQERGWLLSDLGSSNGTRVAGRRSERAELRDGALFELGHSVFRLRMALSTPVRASGDLRSDQQADRPQALRTLLPELALSFDQLARVARSLVPVMLLGETGSGKELFARAIHELSGRAGAFTAVNCGALPATLLEGLLFGHVRGAFSGALRDELGYVRAADRGSLFLDEVGDLPPSSQAALLRVLEEREVVPVGSTRAIPVDLRVVCATHARLPELAQRGGFREDLYARLSGFVFETPTLRERIEDFGLILSALAPELEEAARSPLRLTPEAARLLLAYSWPRNIRELRQCLAAAAVLAENGTIEVAHLPAALVRSSDDQAPRASSAPPAAASAPDALTDDEHARHEELLRLFAEHRGNVTQVARALGKARVQVQRWMKRFGIDPARFRD